VNDDGLEGEEGFVGFEEEDQGHLAQPGKPPFDQGVVLYKFVYACIQLFYKCMFSVVDYLDSLSYI
jgi:hypothetical protein